MWIDNDLQIRFWTGDVYTEVTLSEKLLQSYFNNNIAQTVGDWVHGGETIERRHYNSFNEWKETLTQDNEQIFNLIEYVTNN
jgi:hypothetical protein